MFKLKMIFFSSDINFKITVTFDTVKMIMHVLFSAINRFLLFVLCTISILMNCHINDIKYPISIKIIFNLTQIMLRYNKMTSL